MPLNIDCPCGHNVRIPDEMATGRVKCPVCGELLSIESSQLDSGTTTNDTVSMEATSNAQSVGSFDSDAGNTYSKQGGDDMSPEPSSTRNVFILHGSGGFLFAGLPVPSFFTKSTLSLLPERVRLKSSGPLSTRRADLRLSEVTSAETRQSPAWYLLILGILLLPANGFGLILLLVFLFVRHSFLILRCGTAAIAVRFKGDDTDACSVGDAILQAAAKTH